MKPAPPVTIARGIGGGVYSPLAAGARSLSLRQQGAPSNASRPGDGPRAAGDGPRRRSLGATTARGRPHQAADHERAHDPAAAARPALAHEASR